MDNIFEDYILYYKARMQRWQNNAVYSNSYLSEKALYEFVVACGTMEALQGRAEEFKALTVKNAIALVKDQEALREKAYKYCKETIREKGPANILAQADTVQTDMDLVSMVNKAMQQNSIEITVDELLAMFYSDFVIMENIEVYQQAEIPGEWKEKVKGYAQDIFDSCKKLWQQEQLPAARQWQLAWILDYNLLHEERHRRLIPVNDTELDKKIALHKLLKPV